MARWRVLAPLAALLLAIGAAACGDDEDAAGATTVGTVVVASLAPPAPVTAPPTVVPTTDAATTTSTVPPTLPPTTTTTVAGIAGSTVDALAVRELGRSLEGRPITAVERGTPGGTRVVVIGVIHGDEDDGVAILERLATVPVPEGIDLWLVESMNPDGQAAQQRGNANGVDLNRNFPYRWGPIGAPGDPEYAGSGPASEPETQAIVDLVDELGPALVMWYHQDLFRLSPGEGLEGLVKQRYADLTGLPVERITGGTYTGVAATWARNATEAVSFIVELGPTLSPEEADVHAAAVLDVATLVAIE
jgi:protein MpaA